MIFSLVRRLRRLAAPASLLCCVIAVAPLRADVTGEGDILPQDALGISTLPEDGGPVIGDIIVGGTGSPITGSIPIGRMIIDNPAFTLPLSSTNGFIGGANQFGGGTEVVSATSLGLVTVTGFFSQWNIEGVMSVGGFGQGYLEITGGGLVSTGSLNAPTSIQDDSFVGDEFGSQGYVTINGFGSRLSTKNLNVGRQGIGRVDVTNRGRLESFQGAIVGDERNINTNTLGEGRIVIDGLGTRWNIGTEPNVGTQRGLIIGNEGRGTVEVRNGGVVRVNRDVELAVAVNSYGGLVVTGPDSQLWSFEELLVAVDGDSQANVQVENTGTLRADESMTIGANAFVDLATGGVLLTPTIFNFGVIRGDGRVDTGTLGEVTNDGDIRNAASLANERERLVFTGPVNNNENIESVGGEIEFQGLVTNTSANADIVGIDAIFRFYGGFTNGAGNLYLKNSLIYTLEGQTINNAAFLLVEEGETHINGNFTTTGDMAVEVGHSSSLLSVDGDVNLGGDLFVTGVEGTLGEGSGDGYFPSIGDTFEIITGTTVTGTFADVDDAFSGFDFVADYSVPGSVLLRVSAGFDFDADFDNNGTVDGGDFLTWQFNRGGIVPAGTMGDADGDGNVDDNDYDIWKDQFGGPPAVAAAGAVPEPATAALALMALALPLARRRR